MSEHLYCDGGVIGRNPSLIGGTWAYCLVVDGEIVRSDCGYVSVKDTEPHPGHVTNNLTELVAAVKALEAVGKGWDGTIHTDSSITMTRIKESTKFANIPQWLRLKALEVRRGRKYKVVLLAGHPSRSELIKGVAERNGNPVSKFNVWCDNECKRLSREFIT